MKLRQQSISQQKAELVKWDKRSELRELLQDHALDQSSLQSIKHELRDLNYQAIQQAQSLKMQQAATKYKCVVDKLKQPKPIASKQSQNKTMPLPN